MKVLAFLASLIGFQGVALAGGVPEITCNDGEGFQAVLTIESGTGLGTLTYGQETGEKTTIEGLDTSFNADWGAASKSGEVLLVVTPSGDIKVGQLILKGKTYIMACE
jgi:hypothetical protein